MPVLVTCPCGRPMRVPDDAVGRTYRCPTCGRKAVVQVAPTVVEAQPVPDDELILPRPPLLDENGKPAEALDAEPVLDPEPDDDVLEPEPDEPDVLPPTVRRSVPVDAGLPAAAKPEPAGSLEAGHFAFASPTARKLVKPDRKPRGPERWPWILAGIYATAGLALFSVLIWSVVGDSFRGSSDPAPAPAAAPVEPDPKPAAKVDTPVLAKVDPPVLAKVDPRPLPKVEPPVSVDPPTKTTPEPPVKTEPKKAPEPPVKTEPKKTPEPEPKTMPVPKPEPKVAKKTKKADPKRPVVPTGPEVGIAPADIVKLEFDDVKKLNLALAQLRDEGLKAARAKAATPAPGRAVLGKTGSRMSVKLFACKFPTGATDWATVFVAEFVPGSEAPEVLNRQLDEINRNYSRVFGLNDAELARQRIQFASGTSGNWRTLSFWEAAGGKTTPHNGPGIGVPARPSGI